MGKKRIVLSTIAIVLLVIVNTADQASGSPSGSTLPGTVTTFELPLLRTSTHGDDRNPYSGGSFYRDGTITHLMGMNSREILDVDVDTWSASLVDSDVSCTWSGDPCRLLPLSSAGYAWTGKVFYMAGGADFGDEDQITNKLRRYDPASRTLTDTGVLLPTPWIDGTALWHEDLRELWMLGGATGLVYTKNIWAYSPERGIVRTVGLLPHNTDDACSVYDPVRESAWVLGGHANGIGYNDVVEVLSNGATRIAGYLPVPLHRMGCMWRNGQIVVAGGENPATGLAVDTVYIFDIATGVTTQVATLPRAQLVRSSASDGNRLWLVTGGATVQLVQVGD